MKLSSPARRHSTAPNTAEATRDASQSTGQYGVYPDLHEFSQSVGVPPENLVRVYEIEREFHQRILLESDVDRRQAMYAEVYSRVHPLLASQTVNGEQLIEVKKRFVNDLQRELRGKSILEVGCGGGYFLHAVDALIPHGPLLGIDVSAPDTAEADREAGLTFIKADIIRFQVDRQFAVVLSDNVMEHIAPQDVPLHLQSIRRALEPGGTLIISMPNRLFGPADVTRIVDFSCTGKTPAAGTHLGESTYGEMTALLGQHGFGRFRALPPRFGRTGLRVQAAFFTILEHSPCLTLLYHIRRNGKPAYKCPINLICTKLA